MNSYKQTIMYVNYEFAEENDELTASTNSK